MAIISMTGYGKDEFKLHGTQCTVEVRSVNNRFLEISCHLPKTFSYLEFALKEEVKKFLARGSVNLTVTFGDSEEGSVPTGYSTEAVEAYLKIANDIKTKYHLTGEPTLEQVLSLPNVLVYESEEDQKETEELIKASLDRALQSLVQMREKEGLNLKKDLEARVHEMDSILDEVKVLDPERIVEWKQKFEERLQKLVGEAGLDPVRVTQEASIIADRLDINEEITRFKSHNKLFLATLEQGANQGKKLTFILQEMGREANTLATKCQSAKIAALAIRLKDSVETIREQTMNIE
ncbi:MAG: YicC/YloC family endoribonuclease [Hallerella sp.]|nr:YicC/YloC family endoribonuclease [Fibrobacter sp.]MDY6369735.1 YicC/YloC family endoribonuclease [Fibrobacter sp.]MDY6391026.1 YicC/YloC family endoribonuclease [Fibrobacter sp.]MEE3339340.1 YicC/YloC family endoribonuclease [Hallerella sp.]